GALARAIDQTFGGFEKFREQFKAESLNHFASGWGWLVKNASGQLEIISTHDADTPLAHGKTPLLTADVWEHAYYIDYRNDRGSSRDHFFQVVSWDFVAGNFEYARPRAGRPRRRRRRGPPARHVRSTQTIGARRSEPIAPW